MLTEKLEQQRELFRVEFPQSYSPSIHLEDGCYTVQDISECCVRFKVENATGLKEKENVIGIIRFPDDEIFDCSGEVIRISTNDVIMSLDKPIPLHKLKYEHMMALRYSD